MKTKEHLFTQYFFSLLAITLTAIILAMAFGNSLTAHAADIDTSSYLFFGDGGTGGYYYDYERIDSLNQIYDVTHDTKTFDASYNDKNLVILVSTNGDPSVTGWRVYEYDPEDTDNPYGKYVESGYINIRSNLTSRLFYESDSRYAKLTTNIPVVYYDNTIADLKVCKQLFVDGNRDNVLNDFQVDFTDSDRQDVSYTLTGFQCDDSVCASWTGATEPTRIPDNDDVTINEYVKIYADYGNGREEVEVVPLTDGGWIKAITELSTSDKPLQALEFLPIYSVANGPFGAYYYGRICTVNFDSSGGIADIKDPYEEDNSSNHGGGGLRDNGDRFIDTDTLIVTGKAEELDETVRRSDFYLTDVKVSTGIGGFTKTITWSGTSLDATLSSIPSSDSITIATYGMYDEEGNYNVYELDTVETAEGKIKINYSEFIDEVYASPYTWDGDINISPIYKYGNKLYMGRQTIVDLLHGGIDEWYYDDDGNFVDDTIRNDTEDTGNSSTSENGDGILGSMKDYLENVGSLTEFTGSFFGFLQDIIASMGSFPAMFNTVFGFLPSMYASAIGTFLIVILILRILGR